MSEHGIIFCDELLPGVLNGSVRMTWRVVKRQPILVAGKTWEWPYKSRHDKPGPCKPMSKVSWAAGVDPSHAMVRFCPYGGPGDALWIQCTHWLNESEHLAAYRFQDDFPPHMRGEKWRSPLVMPRWASPDTLVVDSVCCRQIQTITEDEAAACGVRLLKRQDQWYKPAEKDFELDLRTTYRSLYDRVNRSNGHRWADNDWCWGIRFHVKATMAEIMEARDAKS